MAFSQLSDVELEHVLYKPAMFEAVIDSSTSGSDRMEEDFCVDEDTVTSPKLEKSSEGTPDAQISSKVVRALDFTSAFASNAGPSLKLDVTPEVLRNTKDEALNDPSISDEEIACDLEKDVKMDSSSSQSDTSEEDSSDGTDECMEDEETNSNSNITERTFRLYWAKLCRDVLFVSIEKMKRQRPFYYGDFRRGVLIQNLIRRIEADIEKMDISSSDDDSESD